MNDKDIKFLKSTFKKFYYDHFDLFQIPDRINEREFGYQKFNSGMIRHISFKSDRDLRVLLVQDSPSDVYCSNGYYTFPHLAIKEKDWTAADLIFDIDAKDLKLPCRADHNISTCTNCKHVSKGYSCTNCDSTKCTTKSVMCVKCIDGAKKETKNLIKILIDDFGISPTQIDVYFSGNEGFHVYVYDIKFQNLGSKERAELVDYIMFKAVIPETFGIKKNGSKKSDLPNIGDSGWRGRVAKHMYGSKTNRNKVITKMFKDGYQSFQYKLNEMSDTIGVKIDPNVTTDIHRIFRLPGSLNSKSGLAKVRCDDLDKFDPRVDPMFLTDDPVKIIVNCPIPIMLFGEKLGPMVNEEITVPTCLATYLICKHLATIVSQ